MHRSLHCLDNTGCEADRSVLVPGGLPAFFNGRMVASNQIPGTTPLEKLSLKMDNNSALVGGMSSGPAVPLLHMACMVVSTRIQLQLVAVEPFLGGELEYALICRMRVGSQLHIFERSFWLFRCSSETCGPCGLGFC